jgi:hypothetical protein
MFCFSGRPFILKKIWKWAVVFFFFFLENYLNLSWQIMATSGFIMNCSNTSSCIYSLQCQLPCTKSVTHFVCKMFVNLQIKKKLTIKSIHMPCAKSMIIKPFCFLHCLTLLNCFLLLSQIFRLKWLNMQLQQL